MTPRLPDIEFEDTGTGPVVLFVPGSYATPSAWRGVQNAVPGDFRFVTTSQCGYGRTAETRSPHDCGLEHNAAVVRAAAQRAGAAVHLVGHSWGAMSALAVLLEGNVDVLSLTCFEANPWSPLLWRQRDDLIEGMRSMAANFEAAVSRGEADACALVIDYWGEPGSFGAMPPKAQAYCRTVARANALDWRGHLAYRIHRDRLAAIDIPVLFARGSKANAAMVEITEALGAAVPGSRTAIVDGANHFLITTHPRECAELLLRHIRPD